VPSALRRAIALPAAVLGKGAVLIPASGRTLVLALGFDASGPGIMA
jgi:hypothetical protein